MVKSLKKCGMAGYWEWHFVFESYVLMMLLVARWSEGGFDYYCVVHHDEDHAVNETIFCVSLFPKSTMSFLYSHYSHQAQVFIPNQGFILSQLHYFEIAIQALLY
ncbi:hypothetical protein E2542_SST15239 [Spatholobus suberectus]|nr:hypothetical protein E2542_SST15239 [Spatholobus suberectus]